MIPAIITLVVKDYPMAYPIFVACLNPLQGALNTFVYFRPKYKAERQKMVSGSDRRNSRLSSFLKTLNVTLPRRSSVSLPTPPNHDNGDFENSCQEDMEIDSRSKDDEFEGNKWSLVKNAIERSRFSISLLNKTRTGTTFIFWCSLAHDRRIIPRYQSNIVSTCHSHLRVMLFESWFVGDISKMESWN